MYFYSAITVVIGCTPFITWEKLEVEGERPIFFLLQDLNDSPPVFSRQRYFTSVSADLEVGSSILKVEATDADKVRHLKLKKSRNLELETSQSLVFLDCFHFPSLFSP